MEAAPFERVHILRTAALAHIASLLRAPVENSGAQGLRKREDKDVKDRSHDHVGEITDGDCVARHAENDADGIEVRRTARIHARGHGCKLPPPRKERAERPPKEHGDGAYGKQEKRKREEHRLCEPPHVGKIRPEHQKRNGEPDASITADLPDVGVQPDVQPRLPAEKHRCRDDHTPEIRHRDRAERAHKPLFPLPQDEKRHAEHGDKLQNRNDHGSFLLLFPHKNTGFSAE